MVALYGWLPQRRDARQTQRKNTTLAADVANIDEHLVRLHARKTNIAAATAIAPAAERKRQQRAHRHHLGPSNVLPGTAFVRGGANWSVTEF